jgi:hypothetical protein
LTATPNGPAAPTGRGRTVARGLGARSLIEAMSDDHVDRGVQGAPRLSVALGVHVICSPSR